MAEYIEREAVLSHMRWVATELGFGTPKDAVDLMMQIVRTTEAADVAPVKRGRCRYCSPGDGPGVQWDFEDIEVSVTFRGGVLTICNQYGDEAEMPISCCPICGADMRGE